MRLAFNRKNTHTSQNGCTKFVNGWKNLFLLLFCRKMFKLFMCEVSFENIRSKCFKTPVEIFVPPLLTVVQISFVLRLGNFVFCDCNLTSSDAKRKKRRKTRRKTRCKTNDRIWLGENRSRKSNRKTNQLAISTCDSSCDCYLTWALLNCVTICPHYPITTLKYCLIIYFVNALKDLEI